MGDKKINEAYLDYKQSMRIGRKRQCKGCQRAQPTFKPKIEIWVSKSEEKRVEK